jgi:hypothetical protein
MVPFRTTKNPTKSLPQFERCLNAAEMRQNEAPSFSRFGFTRQLA